jgi:hypothetical protein
MTAMAFSLPYSGPGALRTGNHVDIIPFTASFPELNRAFFYRENCMVFSHHHTFTGVKTCSTLANNDVTRNDCLPSE